MHNQNQKVSWQLERPFLYLVSDVEHVWRFSMEYRSVPFHDFGEPLVDTAPEYLHAVRWKPSGMHGNPFPICERIQNLLTM